MSSLLPQGSLSNTPGRPRGLRPGVTKYSVSGVSCFPQPCGAEVVGMGRRFLTREHARYRFKGNSAFLLARGSLCSGAGQGRWLGVRPALPAAHPENCTPLMRGKGRIPSEIEVDFCAWHSLPSESSC